MSDKTLIGADANKHALVVWCDPAQRIRSYFTWSPIRKASFHELMQKGLNERAKLLNLIIKFKKQLSHSPIDEVEMLLILLAMHKTGDVVQVKWHRTVRGQGAKATYKEAKEAFLRNGIIDEP